MTEYLKYIWDNAVDVTKSIALCFCVFCIVYIFQAPIIVVTKEVIVDNVFKKPSLDFFADFLSIILILGSITFVILRVSRDKLKPSIESLINYATLLCIYYAIFKNEREFKYYKVFYSSPIAYLDVVYWCLPVFFLRFRAYASLKTDKYLPSFYEDNFRENSTDLFSRTGIANKVAELIKNTKTDSAFAIAIIGKWGSGKSVFLTFLANELKASNEILHFNPWKTRDSKQIFDSFFKSLSNAVAKYDKNAAKKLKEYAEYLTEIDDENLFSKVTKATISSFSKEPDLNEKFASINKSLKSSGRRFIVFVDDVDRLTGKEILQTLKLIRNAADFGNVFFIAAIDYNYVANAMKKTAEVVNEERYLQKIFQYELILNPIRKDFILSQLRSRLGIDFMSTNERLAFEDAFENLILEDRRAAFRRYDQPVFDGTFENAFESMRDLIRFVNSFQISYSFLKGEIVIQDLLILELIKAKWVFVYQLIAARKILNLSNDGNVQYVYDAKKMQSYRGNLDEEEMSLLESLIERLFARRSDHYGNRSIAIPSNFDTYMHMQLFNSISVQDWNYYRSQSSYVFCKKLEEWIIERKDHDVKQLLLSLDVFNSFIDLKKHIKILLSIKDLIKDDIFVKQSYSLLLPIGNVMGRYKVSNNIIRELFTDIVADSEIMFNIREEFFITLLEEKNESADLVKLLGYEFLFNKIIELYSNNLSEFKYSYHQTMGELFLKISSIFNVPIPIAGYNLLREHMNSTRGIYSSDLFALERSNDVITVKLAPIVQQTFTTVKELRPLFLKVRKLFNEDKKFAEILYTELENYGDNDLTATVEIRDEKALDLIEVL